MNTALSISNAVGSLKKDHPTCFSKIMEIQKALHRFDWHSAADEFLFRNGLSAHAVITESTNGFTPMVRYFNDNVLGVVMHDTSLRDYQIQQTVEAAYKISYQIAFNQLEDISAFVELR